MPAASEELTSGKYELGLAEIFCPLNTGSVFTFVLVSSIQCLGSVKFWYGSGCGSGSSDPYLCLTDPEGPKTYGSYGSGSVRGFGTLIKSLKRNHRTVEINFLLFLLYDERIRSRISTCD
jgi:hypothetical protein